MKAPFDRFGAQTFSLDMPGERCDSFSDNVYCGLSLDYVDGLDDSWVTQGAQFPDRIFGKRKPRLVRVDLEGEYTTRGAVVLYKSVSRAGSALSPHLLYGIM